MRLFMFLGLFLWTLADPALAAQEPFWGQPCAGPARMSSVDLEGVRQPPEGLWQHQFDEILTAPVSWGDALYVLARLDRDTVLMQLDVASGEIRDEVKVRAEGPYWLGVRESDLMVVGADKLVRYRVSNQGLGGARTVNGEFRPSGLITDDLFVTRSSDRELVIFDRDRMREQHRTTFGESECAYSSGKLHTVGSPLTDKTALGDVRYYAAECRLDGRELVFPERPLVGSERITRAGAARTDELIPACFPNWDQGEAYLIRIPSGLGKSASGEFTWSSLQPAGSRSVIEQQAAWHARGMFGLDPDGRVVVETPQRIHTWLTDEGEVPEGAVRGPAACAGDVLYFTNWAFDLLTDEVLWVLPGEPPSGSLLPLPGRRFAAWYADGSLEVYGEPAGSPSPADGLALHAEYLDAALQRPATRPGDGTGVILINGARIAGELGRETEDYSIVQAAEEELVPRTLIGAIETAEGLVLLDGGHSLLLAWDHYLRSQVVPTLDPVFEQFAKLRLAEECERLLAEARSAGVPEHELDGWTARLARVKPTQNARESYGKRAREAEAEVRAAWLEEAGALARWLTEEGLAMHGGAAVARLRPAAREAGSWDPASLKILDPAFPSADLGEDVDLWLDWSAVLASVDAQFLALDDPARAGWAGTRWEQVLAVRTPHAVVVTEIHDVELVGPTVQSVERAFQAMESQFGPMVGASAGDPIEIRVFANQEAMLEADESRERPLTDEVYAYTGSDRALRIAPVERDVEIQRAEFLGMLLERTVGRFLSERWPEEGQLEDTSLVPGAWAVIGMSAWVRAQASSILRGEDALDHFLVPEVDLLCQMPGGRLPFRIGQFFDASSDQFRRIEPGPSVGMRSRVTTRVFTDNAQRAFARQAAVLVGFFLHHCERAGREELVEYLRLFGRGETPREGWKFFGYATAEELEGEFTTFLLKMDSRF